MATTAKGLIKRGDIYHIDKIIGGRRVRGSNGTGDRAKAERILARHLSESFDSKEFGKRPERSFHTAALEYIRRNGHKRTIKKDGQLLIALTKLGDITNTPLSKFNRDTLDEFVVWKRKQLNNRGEPISAGTINHHLKVVRQVLNQAAMDWRDENGLTWLAAAPKIKLLPDNDKRPAHPLKWSEQETLFAELPEHLRRMALFGVNTGCRDREICRLHWEWEVQVEELQTSVFVIPGEFVKNNHKRLVVLNSIARQVIDEYRGQHETHVFCYRRNKSKPDIAAVGKPIDRMLNGGWKAARKAAGLPDVRVHDLKHTFGSRLRNAGLSFEDRQQLLGHKSTNISTHYSAASLANLIEAAQKVVRKPGSEEAIVLRL